MRDHIPELDGIRGLAILLVLWVHTPIGLLGSAVHLARGIAQPGYLGVDIFFVLSGFLITRILLAERERGAPLRNFLMRRFLRIFPIYYLTLVILAIARGGPEIPWCFAYLANFYFPFHNHTSPLQHTWSLAVEEQFYLVWPLLVFLLSFKKSRLAVAGGMIPLALICAAIAVNTYDPTTARLFVYQGSMFRALSLSLGSLLAYAEPWLRARRSRPLGLCAGALVAGALPIYAVGRLVGGVPGLMVWYPVVRLAGFSLVSTSVLLFGIGFSERPAGIIFRNRVAKYVGRISYGLYLYHYPIFLFLGVAEGKPGEIPPWAFPVAFAGSVAIASLSYYLIERPLLRLQRRFRT